MSDPQEKLTAKDEKLDLELSDEHKAFLAKILEICGQNVNMCYQCKKCTSGCPVASVGAMDITPTQVIHMVRLGQVDKLLNSHTIWVCASCETCTTRCPQGVDIARVIDAARNYAKILKRTDTEKSIDIFFTAFMNSLKKHGQLYELGLVVDIKMKTKEFFKDAGLGQDMFLKGKLKILPHNTKGLKELREMLKKIEELESK
ncbi:4Fe-4S dicluster domain-containing protein [Thermodesulfobacteriota bacterium]